MENGAGVVDEFGNVVGGLRSPYLDVPTSTWFGSTPGAGFCVIAGHEVPFGPAQRQQLYRSHGAYVRAWSGTPRGSWRGATSPPTTASS